MLIDDIRKMPRIFEEGSNEGMHRIYRDPDNPLKMYLGNVFCETDEYISFELKSDKGVFLFVVMDTSDIGEIHGHPIGVFYEVAGLDGKAADSKEEAVKYMISKIIEKISGYNLNRTAVEEVLRKTLLPSE